LKTDNLKFPERAGERERVRERDEGVERRREKLYLMDHECRD
jgi:hypothetical protein